MPVPKGSILLSKKHGVKPSVMLCFACSESYGVALFGRIRKPFPTPKRPVIHRTDEDFDAEVPRQIRGSEHDLCDRCSKIVYDGGVLLIEMRAEAAPLDGRVQNTPEVEAARTGRMWGLKREAYDRIFNVPLPSDRGGIVFIGTDATAHLFPEKGITK